ncbi:MAG: hypothetical protein LBM92_07720 [Opitutaceae bacterium]|nr:hypothetical protein [Opitutaceae bacterium]
MKKYLEDMQPQQLAPAKLASNEDVDFSASQVTQFAPAERTPAEVIARRAAMFASDLRIPNLFNATSDAIAIVDEHRQIVFANGNFGALLPIGDATTILGLRPGEALGCIHSHTCNGCGTSGFCRECGAVDAILNSLGNKIAKGDCNLTRSNKGSLESFTLQVKGTPFMLNDERFAIIAFFNINAVDGKRGKEKRPSKRTLLGKLNEISHHLEQLRKQLLS